jgi:adenine-specific DNA-methyltransferase
MKPISEFVNRILTGDCVKVMEEMPTASVDCVITDPPYLVNYHSRDGRRIVGDDKSEWLFSAFAHMYRVLKYNSFLLSFYGWNRADRFLAAWRTAGFHVVGHLVWVKQYHSNEGFVRYCHEQAYLLTKGVPMKPQVALSDVLEWKYTGNELHPTEKPVMALVPPILAFSNVGDIVLDPFAGSGTTAIASRLLGRRYIGIEIDPKYACLAKDRLIAEGKK